MNENEFILKLKENNIEYIKPTYFEIVNRIYKNNESYIINLSENKFGIFIAKELDFMNLTYKFMIFDDCDEFINWYYDKPLNDNTIKINNIIKNSGYNIMVYNKHIMNILLENSIEENQEYLWWDAISCQQKLSEEFMIKFQDKINWRWISSFQKLSESFIRKYEDKLDMDHVSWCQVLTEDFIKEFIHKLHWRGIIECQEVSINFINEYSMKMQG